MEQYTKEQLTFNCIDGVKCETYGFTKSGGSLIFSVYKLPVESKWRNFAKQNFLDFANLYYACMVLDSGRPRTRKRRLFTFVKSMYDQENALVSLIMLKGITFQLGLYADFADVDEVRTVDKVIKEYLPNAGFVKTLSNSGRYIWRIDERRKFRKSIGKAFVLNYINNNFNKDSVWKWVKKHCFLGKDGVWVYKSGKSKQKLLKALEPFLKNGGIIVEENLSSKFEAFIPLRVLNKEATGSGRFLAKATEGDSGTIHIEGVAATTDVDRDEERLSKDFIAKMKKEAIGLPILINTHMAQTQDDTIGVIKKSAGDENSFEIEGDLESPEDNENVKKVLNKMDKLGLQYGFSVGGRVTRAYREYNDDLKKEIVVLADGQLHHVLLTNQPANPQTIAQAMAKSLNDDDVERRVDQARIDRIYSVKHRTALPAGDCPSGEEILKSVSELPDTAFPINHSNREVNKDYAHHFMREGELFIHKDLLVKSYQRALAKKAPDYVVEHLRTHLTMIGLKGVVNNLQTVVKSVEDAEELQTLVTRIGKEVKVLADAASNVRGLKVPKDEKLSMIKDVIADVSSKLTTILEPIEIEE